MDHLGDWRRSMSRWLAVWLVGQWGATLVLFGTLALAGSTAAVLHGSYDQAAPVTAIAPVSATTSTLPSQAPLCWRVSVPSTPQAACLLGR